MRGRESLSALQDRFREFVARIKILTGMLVVKVQIDDADRRQWLLLLHDLLQINIINFLELFGAFR